MSILDVVIKPELFIFRAASGLLFYLGGPAFLICYLTNGGFIQIGLNTKVHLSMSFEWLINMALYIISK